MEEIMEVINVTVKTMDGAYTTERSTPKQTESMPSMSGKKLRKQPPLVSPTKIPREIIAAFLDGEDIETIIGHLEMYQRRGEDRSWKTHRGKLPVALLYKWEKVLYQCRLNGFINPVVISGKLTWAQIIGDRTHADKCTVCPATSRDGSCQGRQNFKAERFNFIPCWLEPMGN
jgi:hypothetical protein